MISKTCLQSHRPFLLPDKFCCLCSVLHFLNSLVVSSATECLILFMILSLYWTSHFVPILLNYSSVLSYSSLRFIKTTILNSCFGKSQISMFGYGYQNIIVILWWYYLNCSCSLKFCVIVFTFEVAVTSSNLYYLWGRHNFCQSCKRFWAFLRPSVDTTAPHFLLPLVE